MVLPTYDERANLEEVVARIRRAVPAADVLVVDDSSPDGTGELADQIAGRDAQVHVLHRTTKQGLGRAYLAGFRWALEREYDAIGEIDADGSHRPEQIPDLLDALQEADLVIGSRWVTGGEVRDWSRRRLWLSQGGNIYTRLLLGVPVRDMTAGFRLFRAEALRRIGLDTVGSAGYVFQADMAYRTIQAGMRVVEVPIVFVDRERGVSKMTPQVAAESLRRITAWGLSLRLQRLRARLLPGRRTRSLL